MRVGQAETGWSEPLKLDTFLAGLGATLMVTAFAGGIARIEGSGPPDGGVELTGQKHGSAKPLGGLIKETTIIISSELKKVDEFLRGLALDLSLRKMLILLPDATHASFYIPAILQSRLGKDIAEIIILTSDEDSVTLGEGYLADFLLQVKTADLTGLSQELRDIYEEAGQRMSRMWEAKKIRFFTKVEGEFDFVFSPVEVSPEDLEKAKAHLLKGGIFMDYTQDGIRVFRREKDKLVSLKEALKFANACAAASVMDPHQAVICSAEDPSGYARLCGLKRGQGS